MKITEEGFIEFMYETSGLLHAYNREGEEYEQCMDVVMFMIDMVHLLLQIEDDEESIINQWFFSDEEDKEDLKHIYKKFQNK